MNNNWNQSGTDYYLRDASNQSNKLDNAIYSMEQNPMTGELYLKKIADSFDFKYKMYDIHDSLIDRALKFYQTTKGHLGILLNGVKGTGKSVTAKLLSNKLEQPTILINTAYKGIPDFVNQIQQNITILGDEFEKVFPSKSANGIQIMDTQGGILTLMDGVLDNGFRRAFLLTTNELNVNVNLIQRPSRIRYIKAYGDLSREAVEMIVDDCLEHKHHREATIEFISTLELITVDIVKSVISEVNIFDEAPEAFKDVFNVKPKSVSYTLYQIDDKGDEKRINCDLQYRPDRSKNYFENGLDGFYEYLTGRGDYKWSKTIDEDSKLFEIVEADPNDEMLAKKMVVKLSLETSKHKAFMMI